VVGTATVLTGAASPRPVRGLSTRRHAPGVAPARTPRLAAVSAGLLGWLASAALAATPERLLARGACRDGVPNGAYTLAMPDGTMRVVGAFAKGRRTGTFLFWGPIGARVAVIPYEDDVKVGTVALWYAPPARGEAPRRRLEAPYAAGLRNGVTRSWYASGARRAEYRYEHGELAEARAWSEAGEPLSDTVASGLAARDRASDAEVFADLERTIAENLPQCR
jgi:hypothetical protein